MQRTRVMVAHEDAMTDNRNYLLVHDTDVPRVAKHIGLAMADIGVKLVAPETLGAHHASLRALRSGDVALEFGDDWHPYAIDRDLARALARRLRAPVASCFLASRAEVETVRLYRASKSVASYLMAGEPAQWTVTAGKRTLRLEVEPTEPTEDEDEEELFDQQLAAFRRLQSQAFRALPFAPLLEGARWHDLSTKHAKKRGPAMELSFLDDTEDLEPARLFERQLEDALGAWLSALGFRRSKARGSVPDTSRMVDIAFVRDFGARRLHVSFFSRGTLPDQRINIHFRWFAWHKPQAAHLSTGQHLQLADRVAPADLTTTFKRGLRVLQVFAPELREDIKRVLGRDAPRAPSDRDKQRLWNEHVVDTGQQTYEYAMEARESGDHDQYRASLRSLVTEYPGNPRAADARKLLRDKA